jgi:hypothetical protein
MLANALLKLADTQAEHMFCNVERRAGDFWLEVRIHVRGQGLVSSALGAGTARAAAQRFAERWRDCSLRELLAGGFAALGLNTVELSQLPFNWRDRSDLQTAPTFPMPRPPSVSAPGMESLANLPLPDDAMDFDLVEQALSLFAMSASHMPLLVSANDVHDVFSFSRYISMRAEAIAKCQIAKCQVVSVTGAALTAAARAGLQRKLTERWFNAHLDFVSQETSSRGGVWAFGDAELCTSKVWTAAALNALQPLHLGAARRRMPRGATR